MPKGINKFPRRFGSNPQLSLMQFKSVRTISVWFLSPSSMSLKGAKAVRSFKIRPSLVIVGNTPSSSGVPLIVGHTLECSVMVHKGVSRMGFKEVCPFHY